MDTSAAVVLTFNRAPVIEKSLIGLLRYTAPETPIAVFEDGGYYDDTEGFLTKDRTQAPETDFTRSIEAIPWVSEKDRVQVFMGTRNLGVAGNSNRAIHWFLTQTTADHLCLCNDDIDLRGDFVSIYREAHKRLGVGLLCLMPFDDSDTYRPNIVMYRGQRIKLCPRMTGIMMSYTRECLEDIGYYDMTFKKWGQEHCDHTNRARFMGHIALDNHAQGQIDIVQDCVTYQPVGSSISGNVRDIENALADKALAKAVARYRTEGCYKPFATERPDYVGACMAGAGIDYSLLKDTHAHVTSRIPFVN